MHRRTFIQTAGIAALGAACTDCGNRQPETATETMSYTVLGKTGIQVSRLSFGSHLSEASMADPVGRDRQIQFGIERGITLFDIYNHTYGQFEPMAKSLAGHPDVHISLYMEFTENIEEEVDKVLRLFNREAIDFFRAMYEPVKLEGLMKVRDKGKVRAVGIANHFEEDFVKAINQYGDDLDYIIFPYNFVHNKWLPNDKANTYDTFNALAKKHNYGLIGMKPFCNEMLVTFAKEQGYIGGPKDRGVSVPAAAIRYSLSSGAVHTALPAMNSVEEVEENLQGVYRPELSDFERSVLEEIDQLATAHQWAYLNRKPQYRWLADWARPGVFDT